ncbi:hypothetical protein J3R82DRAFT_10354 [Butyriboletus roseoflavus]|nr:hypothetical protein J3R82DRAFT_10354 [Butyriboletus roseoflavus]
MVAPSAREDWERWMKRYDEVALADELAAGPMASPRDAMQDTVGAIAWDSEGNLAAGVSSGGLLLKYSGRVGEVKYLPRSGGVNDGADRLIRGRSCLERDVGQSNRRTGWLEWLVAYQVRILAHILNCSFTRISGAGEHIIRTELARTIADVLRPRQDGTEVDVHDMLMRTLSTQFHGVFG